MTEEFTKKEIKLLRLLIGSGLVRFRELRWTKKDMMEFEDVTRHFMLATQEKARLG